jgi:hypothetical protein
VIGVLVLAGIAGVITVGSSPLATEERVLIFSWSVWTWPRRLVRAYRYNPCHRRTRDVA